MRNQKKHIVQQLDNKLNHSTTLEELIIPTDGWIYTIRKSLNITLEQLGRKIGISSQGMKKLEENESKGKTTINSLKRIAYALDLRLVYGFVPKDESFEKLVYRRAKKLAESIVLRTNQTMILEDQSIDKEDLTKSIEELTEELVREMKKSIWD